MACGKPVKPNEPTNLETEKVNFFFSFRLLREQKPRILITERKTKTKINNRYKGQSQIPRCNKQRMKTSSLNVSVHQLNLKQRNPVL